MDTDLKELVYKSIERAFVTEKDIADYRYLWKKHRIYVAKEYSKTSLSNFNYEQTENDMFFLNQSDLPNSIQNVSFCLKSKEELQKIADRTWEDFLHVSFGLIKIEDNIATIRINNTWISSKHSKKSYLSGGGYTLIYKKNDGKWTFQEITSRWIS